MPQAKLMYSAYWFKTMNSIYKILELITAVFITSYKVN